MIRFWLRYHRIGLLLLLLLTVPAAYFSAKLYGNVKPDLEELLPKQSRAILDLEEIRSRLLSVQKLHIIVSSKDALGAKQFQDDLAQKLLARPKSEIASVEYRIDKELKFFEERRSLFLEVQDLERIRNYIGDRVEYEKSIRNPLNIFAETNIQEPNLDFRALELKYKSKAGQYTNFPEGYYSTPDGTLRLITAYLPAEKSGVEGVYGFKKRIESDIKSLAAEKYPKDLQVKYAGPVQDIIEEHSALMNDIERSAQIVFAIVLIALIFFFRSILATIALLVSLFMARFWTFGASWFLVGSLNANSAFMGSIVLGSGITYGVMLLARYLEERRKKQAPIRAAYRAIRATARATWAAALCAGFAYGALFVTEFEGFKQYGLMGLIGMVLCWLSSVLVLPALLLEIERFKPLVVKTGNRKPFLFGPLTDLLRKRPGTVLAASIAATVISLLGFTRFDTDQILEKNLANLRNQESMRSGSGYNNVYVDEILKSPNAPIVVLAYSLKSAEEIARRLEVQRRNEGKDSLILQVADIHQFIPRQQTEKLRLLGDIQHLLPARIRYRLEGSDQSKISELLSSREHSLISQMNLPQLIKDKFTEKDGSIGRLVLVDPRQDSALWSGFQLADFIEDVRRTADEVDGRKVPVAGQLTVTSDMIGSIVKDGPKATLVSLGCVIVLIFMIYRNISTAILMLSGLMVGGIWMMGFVLWTGMKINFLNFIALPITFGIGVDYGVNVLDRYMREPKKDILRVVRETGGAVGLCSFTTIVGYSSLLIAKNGAFVSFGLLAVLGEVTTMLAAVLALPAAVLMWEKRQEATLAAAQPASKSDLPLDLPR
jgi:predicted RND superfamily exporter protein